MSCNGALSGLRVIELDDGWAQLGGKLLADLGADVVKVEPLDGSPARREGPFRADVPDVDGSLHFWHHNTSKRSVAVDFGTSDGIEVVRSVLRTADVLLDGLAVGRLASFGLDDKALRELNTSLTIVHISPFGQQGPWSGYLGSDLVNIALGGTAAVCGYDAPSDAGPIAPTGGQAANLAGVMGATAALAAEYRRRRTQQGQTADVSAHDVMSLSTEMAIPFWEFQQRNGIRQTGRHGRPFPTPAWNHQCSDGKYLNAMPLYLDDDRYRAMVEWFDSEGLAEDLASNAFGTEVQRTPLMGHIVDVIGRFCAGHTLKDMFDGAQSRRLPWGPVNAPEDLYADEHLLDREALVEIAHDDEPGRSYVYPGRPYRLSRTAWSASRAPRLGEHTIEVLAEISR